jgi:hypothetical protein
MPDSLRPNQGQQDVVILLTLILVNCGHLINKLKPASYRYYLHLPSLYITYTAKQMVSPFIVVARFAYTNHSDTNTNCSRATGKATFVGQLRGWESDEEDML